jgi:hypothetical protein
MRKVLRKNGAVIKDLYIDHKLLWCKCAQYFDYLGPLSLLGCGWFACWLNAICGQIIDGCLIPKKLKSVRETIGNTGMFLWCHFSFLFFETLLGGAGMY